MLLLTRKKGEEIIVGEGLLRIAVIELRHDSVRLGIEAPEELRVDRKEVHLKRQAEKAPLTPALSRPRPEPQVIDVSH